MSLYEIIGISPDATTAQIRSAFRARALLCHPDRRTPYDAPAASSAGSFTELVAAYELLVDPIRRAQYDATQQSRSVRAAGCCSATYSVRDFECAQSEVEDAAAVSITYTLECRCGGSFVVCRPKFCDTIPLPLHVECDSCSLIVKVIP